MSEKDAKKAEREWRRARWPRCVTCKKTMHNDTRWWRVAEGKWECTDCHNQSETR